MTKYRSNIWDCVIYLFIFIFSNIIIIIIILLLLLLDLRDWGAVMPHNQWNEATYYGNIPITVCLL